MLIYKSDRNLIIAYLRIKIKYSIKKRRKKVEIYAGVVELADAQDSKSCGSDTVWVRPPPPAPKRAEGIPSALFGAGVRGSLRNLLANFERTSAFGGVLPRGSRLRETANPHHGRAVKKTTDCPFALFGAGERGSLRNLSANFERISFAKAKVSCFFPLAEKSKPPPRKGSDKTTDCPFASFGSPTRYTDKATSGRVL